MTKMQLFSKGHSAMAKGQKRSNREIRKPKQVKTAPKAESPSGSQVKLAANINNASARAKAKN
jgi:hypothetical protein